MEANESIVRLGETLDKWIAGNLTTLTGNDRVAQGKARLGGIEIVKELDRIKAKGLAELKALLRRQNWSNDEDRVASLVRGFEFGAKLKHTLRDEVDGQRRIQ